MPLRSTWADAIAAIVEGAGVDDVASLVVAPLPDGLSAGVWLATTWESFPYPGDATEAAGSFPLTGWRDGRQASASSPNDGATPPEWSVPRRALRLAEAEADAVFGESWERLHVELTAAARIAATGALARLGDAGPPVGVFVGHGRESHALLVALCHEAGGALWPVMVKRREDGANVYPHVALVEDGLLLFFCEEESDAVRTMGTSSRRGVRHWRFDEIAHVRDGEDGIVLHFRGSSYDVELEAGHTHEEYGGPRRDDVRTALRAHFERRAPQLWFEPSMIPAPGDGAALRALVDAYADDHASSFLFSTLAAQHPEATLAVVDEAGLDAPKRVRLLETLAAAFVAAGRWERAAAVHAALPAKGRYTRDLTSALLMLGRNEEIAAAAAAPARLRAVALARLGRRDEAMALLQPKDRRAQRSDSDDLATLALVAAAAGDEDGASAALYRRALAEGSVSIDLARLATQATELRPLLDEVDALDERRRAAGVAAAAAPWIDVGAAAAPRLCAEAHEGIFWRETIDEEEHELESPLASACFVGADAWGGSDDGALWRLDRNERLGALFSDALSQLHASDAGLVASDERTVVVVDAGGAVIARSAPFVGGEGAVACHGDLVAHHVSRALDIVDARGERRGTWAHGDRDHLRYLAFAAPALLVVATAGQVHLVDVSRPSEPVSRGRLQDIDDIGGVAVAGDVVVIRSREDVVLLSFADPQRPRALARVAMSQMPAAAREGDRLWLFTGDGELWCIEVDARAGVARAPRRFGVYVGEQDLPTPLAFRVEGDHLRLVARTRGLLALTLRRFPRAEIAAALDAYRPRITAWLREQLRAALDAEIAVGIARVSWRDARVSLVLSGPTSILACEGPLAGARSFELPIDAEERDDDGPGVAADLKRGLRCQLATATITRALRDVADVVRDPRAAAEVFLCAAGFESGTTVVVVDNPGGVPLTSPPLRRNEPTLLERLTGRHWYDAVEGIVKRGRRDPALRAELREVLVNDDAVVEGALRACCALYDVDPASFAAAFVSAASVDARGALAGLLLARDEPAARAVLERLVDDDDDRLAIPALRALGRLEEPASLERVRELLRTRVDRDDDLPYETLGALTPAALATLRDEVEELWRADEDDAARLVFAILAGVDDIPSDAWIEAGTLRELEGDPLLGSAVEREEEPRLVALRTLAARRVRERLRADDAGTLWPGDLPPETSSRGWERFLERLWPQLEDVEREALLRRVGRGDDPRFGIPLLLHLLLRGDERAAALGAALRARATESGMTIDEVARLARLGRVQLGWKRLKAGDLLQARAVADAALADEPDGQALFFDARLTWLERSDPAAALPKIDAALARATDKEGLARLYNLRGAVLDALGQPAESISWFERALAVNPDDAAMLLSNIAEAYEKCGRLADARAFAERARASGATSDVVERLLAGS